MTNDRTTLPQASVDMNVLRKLAEEKLITTQKHPEYDLLIHNYTPVCQYSFAWDDMTRMCRGLITDLQGTIIARPFPKFFNLAEHFGNDCKLPPINWKQNFVVTEKFDGSLGVLYPTPKGYMIATRGSFTSEQAIKGTMMLAHLQQNFDPQYTYLFEILYADNRIVVDYGGAEKLVLLDVIETTTGKSVYDFERFTREIGCDGVFDMQLTKEQIESVSGANREGVVVRFEDGTRIKVKIEEYVRLHRLITGTNARSIWDILRTGGNLTELLDRVPDEYYDWVKKTEKELQGSFAEIMRTANEDFAPNCTKEAKDGYTKCGKHTWGQGIRARCGFCQGAGRLLSIEDSQYHDCPNCSGD